MVESKKASKGFTIVELLIVIVIIAILGAISFVVYNGLTNRAKRAAIEAEADKLTKQLAIYRANNETYPERLESDDCNNIEDSTLCFESDYFIDYGLISYDDDDPTNDDYYFEIWPFDDEDDNSNPCKEEGCGGGILGRSDGDIMPGLPEVDCPEGFIPVPGSAFYSQPGFCVMKYEASNLGGKAVSRYNLPSWGSVTHNQALEYATEACEGCGLITESQWMTLARDILREPKNWTSGQVGEGKVFHGFSTFHYSFGEVVPFIIKSSNDDNGYFAVPEESFLFENENDFINYEGSRRTFYLSNGEVIWDLAGHFAEHTNTIMTSGKPGCATPSGSLFCDSLNILQAGSIVPNILPSSMGLGYSNEELATITGSLFASYYDDLSEKGLVRGLPLFGGCGLLSFSFQVSPDKLTFVQPWGDEELDFSMDIYDMNGDPVQALGFRATLE